jgi:hypothetical protein
MKHGLIITHAGSGGTLLCRILSTDYSIRSFGRTGINYDHPSVIKRARNRIDKIVNVNSRGDRDWYVDKLLFNYEFTCKPLYSTCKFVYLVRSPKIPLATLMQRGYSPKGAETYYLFRLRRMCEMSRNTVGSPLLTYEDLISKRGFPLLKTLFKLKSPLSDEFTPLSFDDANLFSGVILKEPIEPQVEVPADVLERCTAGYHRYLNFMQSRSGLIRFAF